MNVVDKTRFEPAGRFSRDPEKSFTLPARYYIDPQIYEREKREIFYRAWNYGCHVSQVAAPGSFATVQVADQNIAILRGQDGVLRAFHNVCSHRAHELLKGCGTAKLITCPYHAWTYHTDGRLRSAVGQKSVSGFQAEEFALKPVQLEVYAGFVFVNLDMEAPPLRSQAGDLEQEMLKACPKIADLTFAYRLTYEVKGNWKNVVDNFLECYHCQVAHPAFVELVDIQNYRTKTHGIYSSHISPPGSCANAAYSFSKDEERDYSAWWLWPNVTFGVFPGTDNVLMFHMLPTGPETTVEHLDFYTVSPALSQSQEDAKRYLDEVLQPEDITLVESVQRGLHSIAYNQGRFIIDRGRTFMSEHGLHHFHSLVLDALGDLPAE
ncbi:aromatic ring-hydroxylating oxygenase subunit alpha [Aestuariivirga sp.]|uniref:aromatic ring-hydroxylating oxygenase subunit alpha n=1 Tax=Aestuariivirga sp. TaxID=2650926 RepID=UPI0039E66F2E